MRCASLAIGVSTYREDEFRSNDTRLHFSVEDARAFADYASIAWPTSQTDSVHLLLTDEAASAVGIQRAFDAIREAGSFDLVLIYLSGHGQRGAGSIGWFCLWDAVPGSSSLDGVMLDGLLRRLDAATVLLIVDCCHAESVTAGLAYFTELDGKQARLFCASARADERAWEDSGLRRSVLSHVLFLGLSQTSTLADPTGHVRLNEVLFPYLRDQVPLLASRIKGGAIQQPVIGGLAAGILLLPTVETKSIGRALTLRETLRNQLRRMLIGLLTIAGISLVLIESLITHLAIDGDQAIVVRPGLASTFSLLPLHLSDPVDTGFHVAQLDRTNANAMQSLAVGGFRSLSTQLTTDGLRLWIDQLDPLLKDRKALEFTRIHEQERDGGASPAITLGAIHFGARITDSEPTSYAIRQNFLGLAPLVNVACESIGNERIADFDTTETPSAENFIRAFVRYGAGQGADPSAELWRLARFVSARALRRNYDATAQAEVVALLEEVARSGSEIALSPDTLSAMRAVLPPAKPNSCSMLAIGMMIALGPDQDKATAEAQLRAASGDDTAVADIMLALRTSGAPFESLLPLPKRYFSIIAKYRPLLKDSLVDAEGWVTTGLNEDTERLLENAPLQSQAYDRLIDQLRVEGDSYDQSVALRYLARSYAWLTPPQRKAVDDWTATNVNPRTAETDVTLSVALLGRSRPLDVAVIAEWVSQLSAGVSADAQSEFEQGHVIAVDARAKVAALAIAAPRTKIPKEAMNQVEDLLASRSSIPLRAEAITGLAAFLRSQGIPLPVAIQNRLLSERGNASKRMLTVDIAVSALNGLEAEEREQALHALAAYWRDEREPELRRDFGLILAKAD